MSSKIIIATVIGCLLYTQASIGMGDGKDLSHRGKQKEGSPLFRKASLNNIINKTTDENIEKLTLEKIKTEQEESNIDKEESSEKFFLQNKTKNSVKKAIEENFETVNLNKFNDSSSSDCDSDEEDDTFIKKN